MGDWDDELDDNNEDLHYEHGDSGLDNTFDLDLPPILFRQDPEPIESGGFDDSPPDGELDEDLQALQQLLDDIGYSLEEALRSDDGRPLSPDEALEMGYEVRGTVYSSPDEAFQAAIDAGIPHMAIVVEDEDGYRLGITYSDVT